jgi:hypothetical protein
MMSGALLDVLETLLEEAYDVLIVQGVEHHAPGPARPDDSHAPKQPELVRDRGFAQSEQARDVADAELGSGDGVEDSHARRIAEETEGLRQRSHCRSGEQPLLEVGGFGGPEMEDLAGVSRCTWLDRSAGGQDPVSTEHMNN